MCVTQGRHIYDVSLMKDTGRASPEGAKGILSEVEPRMWAYIAVRNEVLICVSKFIRFVCMLI